MILLIVFFLVHTTAVAMETPMSIPEQRYYYTVEDGEDYLFAVAIKLYGDSKYERKLALWNRMVSPYKVKPGQKLILKEPPKLSSAKGNLLLLKHYSKVYQQSKKNITTVYRKIAQTPLSEVIQDNAKVAKKEKMQTESSYAFRLSHGVQSLSQVAQILYGDASLWPEIAEWNQMQAQDAVYGQVLKIQKAPTRSLAEGYRIVIGKELQVQESELFWQQEEKPLRYRAKNFNRLLENY